MLHQYRSTDHPTSRGREGPIENPGGQKERCLRWRDKRGCLGLGRREGAIVRDREERREQEKRRRPWRFEDRRRGFGRWLMVQSL